MPYYKANLKETQSTVNQAPGVGNCYMMAPKAAVELVGGSHDSINEASVPQMGGTCKTAFEKMGYTLIAPDKQSQWLSELQKAVESRNPACLLITWWQVDEVVSKEVKKKQQGSGSVIKKGVELVITTQNMKGEIGKKVTKTNKPPTQAGAIEVTPRDGSGKSVLVNQDLTIKVSGPQPQQQYTVKGKVTGDKAPNLILKVNEVKNQKNEEVSFNLAEGYEWNLGIWKKYGKHVVYLVGYEENAVFARDQQNGHAEMSVNVKTWQCESFQLGALRDKAPTRGCSVDSINIGDLKKA